jgi:hypothetical protein
VAPPLWIPDQVRDGEKEEPPPGFRWFIVFIGQMSPLTALARNNEEKQSHYQDIHLLELHSEHFNLQKQALMIANQM